LTLSLAADWAVIRLGFERVAYRGLETGHRNMVSHVVRQGKIVFVFSSPLTPVAESEPVYGERSLPTRVAPRPAARALPRPRHRRSRHRIAPPAGQTMSEHLAVHGDGVKDVAFAVSDCRAIFESAKGRGAKVIAEPHEEEDADGKVIMATVATYGDTVHTFVQRVGYTGAFLPNYKAITEADPLAGVTAPIGLDFVDHVVGNMVDGGMEPSVSWYEKMLQFHRFWSVDDKQIHTEYSSLRSIVVADYDEVVKMPINEPAAGKRKSQIQEYVEYYGGNGVQHIALNTRDIISAITNLRARGVKFLKVPTSYYDSLDARLAAAGMKVAEDMATIRALNILVDFDEHGYLLQLFTANVLDRPTVFLEVIQREGNSGFGAGNFKSLFEAIEREQAARGNLTNTEAATGAAAAAAASASAGDA